MKKNMRKVAALGLCVALGATMLTACGGSKGESASGGKTELNFGIWDENQRPAMEKMVKAYEKENSDVKINIQLTPYKGGEYWTKLEAAASGGKAPDVFWLNVLHLDSYVEGGILYDLEATELQKAYNGEKSLSDVCKGLTKQADKLLQE